MLSIFEPIQRTWNIWQQPPKLNEDGLETITEYRQRRTSIHVVNFTYFLRILGYTIITPGVWPYLDKLDPDAGKVFLGYVVAANPLGQMLFEPLFAHWGNQIKSVRIPMIVTIGVFCLSNILYSYLGAFPIRYVKYIMLLSRFLTGVGSANMSLCRVYISEAARASERNGDISVLAMALVLSSAIGPALQSCVTSLGENGITIIPGLIALNMYTATGWINVALSIANIVLCLPVFFKEKRIAVLEVMAREGLATEEETYKNTRIDYFAVCVLLAGIFIACCDYTSIQMISSSLTMDQFAWSRAEALNYMSLIMASGSIVALSSFMVVPALCRKFSERHVLIFVGYLALLIGCGLNIPFLGGSTPKMNEPYNMSKDAVDGVTQNFEIHSTNTIELVGCPISQKWCQTTPALTVTQFLIGYAFTSFGYCITVTLMQIIFSTVLGCRPQGVWLGLFTGFMSGSRILGPIFIGNTYPAFGMYWTFGSMTVFVFLGMFSMWMLRHRLKAPIRPTASLGTVANGPVEWITKL